MQSPLLPTISRLHGTLIGAVNFYAINNRVVVAVVAVAVVTEKSFFFLLLFFSFFRLYPPGAQKEDLRKVFFFVAPSIPFPPRSRVCASPSLWGKEGGRKKKEKKTKELSKQKFSFLLPPPSLLSPSCACEYSGAFLLLFLSRVVRSSWTAKLTHATQQRPNSSKVQKLKKILASNHNYFENVGH